MKKILALFLAAVMVATLGSGIAFAGIGSDIGESGDNGTHFNLNIIGVPKGKTADMTNSDRHTIFVPLDKSGNAAPVKIYVGRNVANPTQFDVTDGNAFDGSATLLVPFVDYGTLSYNVYAASLGKPGYTASVNATVTFQPGTYGNLLMGSFTLNRAKGNPTVKDISDIFRATGWIDVCGTIGVQDPCDISFTNVWVFNVPTLLSYFWDYDANGMKHMQIRFYETTSGSWTNVPQ